MKNKLIVLLASFFFCALLVGATELVSFFLYQTKSPALKPQQVLNLTPLSSFHIKPFPLVKSSFQGREIKLTKDIEWETIPEEARDELGRPLFSHKEKTFYPEKTPLWEQFYTIDQYRFRVTPQEKLKKETHRYLALLGDSHIFGTGLADHQTISEKLSHLFPDTYVQNLAYPTAYPGEILDLARELSPVVLNHKIGDSLYFFFEYQLLRNKGGIFNLSSWESIKPMYGKDQNNKIVKQGSFAEVLPGRTRLARLLYKSYLFKYWQLDLRIEEEDLDFAVEMIKETKKAMGLLGSEGFVVIFYPYNQTPYTLEIMKRLSQSEIYFIDLTHIDLFQYIKEPFIPWDGHPQEEANEFLAQLINQGLSTIQSLSKNTPGVN